MSEDEGERRVEDLFEGLDDFFAPIESGDWPEEEEAGEPPEAEEVVQDEGDEDWSPEIVIPDEEDLFAEDTGSVAEDVGPEAAEIAAETSAEPDDEWVREQTRELSVEELAGLREEFAEEPVFEEEPVSAPTPEEAGVGADDTSDEASRDLTVADLRPPAEYAGLPGAERTTPPFEDERELPSAEETPPSEEMPVLDEATAPEEIPALEESEPLFAEPGEAEFGLFPDVEREPETVAAASAEDLEERGPEEVEAAAEHFAAGIRESPEEVERELLADLGRDEEPATVRISGLPEDAEGPAWEDAAIGTVIRDREEEVAAAPPPEAPSRNLVAALISGLVLGGLVIALLAIGKGPFGVLAGVVILLAQAEFYGVVTAHRYRPATALGLVTGGLILGAAYFKGEAAMLFSAALGMGLSMLWYMASPPAARKRAVTNIGVTVMGILYIPFLAGYILLVLSLPGNLGRDLILLILVLTVLYDVCAFAIGSLWGSRPLAPNISPRKSWEGAIGATFILLLVGLAVVPSIEPFNASRAVGLALVISVFAPIGDLAESVLKRDLGVKDMSGILPGHGGVLDRIDSLLFTIPASFYFFRLVF